MQKLNHLEYLSTFNASSDVVFQKLTNPSLFCAQLEQIIQIDDVKIKLPYLVGEEALVHFRWQGLYISCAFVVDEYVLDKKFSYHQSSGIMDAWRHEIEFEPISDDLTQVREKFSYSIGWGLLGAIVDDFYFRSRLRDYLKMRAVNISKLI